MVEIWRGMNYYGWALLFSQLMITSAFAFSVIPDGKLTFSIVHEGEPILEKVGSGFFENGSLVSTGKYEALDVVYRKNLTILTYTGPKLPILVISFEERSNGMQVRSRLEFDKPTVINGICPLLVEATSASRSFDSFYSTFVNAYLSWAFSGWVEIDKRKSAFDDPLSYLAWGDNDRHLFQDSHLSWWFTMYSDRLKKKILLLGALTAQTHKTAFVNLYSRGKSKGFYAVNGAKKERIFGRKVVESEQLYLTTVEDPAELVRYTALIEEVNGITFTKKDLSGWNSWNAFFDKVSPTDILKNLDLVVEKCNSLQLKVIYIDDGWSMNWGDWLPNDRFEGVFDRLVEKIGAHGFRPGIWISPFVIDMKSSVFTKHQDWLLKDELGRNIPYDRLPQLGFLPKSKFILDVTNEAVQKWLVEVFLRLYAKGFRVFKIDFLFGAAYEGNRSKQLTAIESYRLGLALIRNTLPDDASIIACGALPLPSAGLCDAYRVGPDILQYPTPLTGVAWPFLANAARSAINLFPFNNTLFLNDPDTLIIRSPLTKDQLTASLMFTVLSDGPFVLGDDLTTLDDERFEVLLDPLWLRLRKMKGRIIPLDHFEKVNGKVYNPTFGPILDRGRYSALQPELWMKENSSSTLLAIFNWGSKPLDRSFDLEPYGIKPSETSQLVGGPYLIKGGRLSFTQRPTSVHLYEFRHLDHRSN